MAAVNLANVHDGICSRTGADIRCIHDVLFHFRAMMEGISILTHLNKAIQQIKERSGQHHHLIDEYLADPLQVKPAHAQELRDDLYFILEVLKHLQDLEMLARSFIERPPESEPTPDNGYERTKKEIAGILYLLAIPST